jgi:hypothetical protein
LTVEPRMIRDAVLVLFFVAHASCGPRPDRSVSGGKHVLLLGASVGKYWRLAGLPQRVRIPLHSFESIAVYQFDKTEALKEVLLRPQRKFRLTRSYLKGIFQAPPRRPDLVIIKECAAYFPGDLQAYERLVQNWVQILRDAGVVPVVATVAPVTRARDARKPGQMADIRRFNGWMREYSRRERLALVDINAVLGGQGPDGFLSDELTSGDGLHLNADAYRLLDGEIVRLLGSGFTESVGGS